jgi:hypothetical protein
MFAVIFATPDFGAGAVAAFILLLLTIPLAVFTTVLILWGFCRLRRQKYSAWLATSAALLATYTTCAAGFRNGLRGDLWLGPPLVGMVVATVAGLLYSLLTPSDRAHGTEPGQDINHVSDPEGGVSDTKL